jgi:hypothetical protein
MAAAAPAFDAGTAGRLHALTRALPALGTPRDKGRNP